MPTEKVPFTPQSAETGNKKRVRLAENSTTFELAQLKKKKAKEDIQKLLDEAAKLKPSFDAAEKRLKEIRMKLFEYAVDNDTNGFRTPDVAFQFSGMRIKQTLSTTKLLENGVSLPIINKSYVVSEEWPDTKFVLFGKADK